MEKINLSNGIPAIIKTKKNTPRIALTLYTDINIPEKKPGIYTLMNRLFLQGTKNRTAEQLAQELDENAIECFSEMKYDFLRFRVLCLNEDFPLAMEILEDIIKNSHFETFEKEIIKLKGELTADLDSPKTKALDNYYKTFFENHFYGNTYTKMLEAIDSITFEDVIGAFNDVVINTRKTICVAGDIDKNEVTELLQKHLGFLKNNEDSENKIEAVSLSSSKSVFISKEEAAQAQIIKGWQVPSIYSDEHAALILLSTILGSSGLSSRLFVELRDKKGLAYTVRSSYETYKLAASFSVYIATEPKNIGVSLEGFATEIEKLKTELVAEKELNNAKTNIIGKRQFYSETNMQYALLLGLYEIEKLGYDYEKKLIENINKVTAQDIKNAACKYLNDVSVLSVLAPGEYLKELQ